MLSYPTKLNTALVAGDELAPNLKNHVVLLRRLANPYLPPNDPNVTVPGFVFNPANPVNPFITVDFMDNVPTFDAIQRKSNGTMDRDREVLDRNGGSAWFRSLLHWWPRDGRPDHPPQFDRQSSAIRRDV